MPDSAANTGPGSEVAPVDAEAFWQFSLSVYARPGVADLCLALQDRAGANVNLLLFCCWIAEAFAARLDIAAAERLIREVQPWEDDVVQPLRRIRRTMKTRKPEIPAIEQPRIEALRDAIKRAELDAEHSEQRLLALAWPDRLAPATRASSDPPATIALANIADYMAAAGLALPVDHPGLAGDLVEAIFTQPRTPRAGAGKG